jgi:hypothetical protein
VNKKTSSFNEQTENKTKIAQADGFSVTSTAFKIQLKI